MQTEPEFQILVLDHRGEGLAERLGAQLGQGFRWQGSSSLRESQALLAQGGFDLVVLNPLVDAGASEIELCATAPLCLYLCDEPARAQALSWLARRSHDFDLVSRSACVEELCWRIDALLSRSLAMLQIESLRHQALHDERTGLLRAKAFEARLAEHFSASRRHQLPLCLLLIDLDRFGWINKRLDHTRGDQALEAAANAIRAELRAEDSAGRLGGDEFGVLLPYTSATQGARVVVRLVERLRALNPHLLGAQSGLKLTGSIGFESASGRDLEDHALLREHAERALRAAKERGGDCGVYFRSIGPRLASADGA